MQGARAGSVIALPEDAWLRVELVRHDADTGSYYLSELSTGQCLRHVPPELPVRIQRLAAQKGEAWVSANDYLHVQTVGGALALVSSLQLNVIDLELHIEGLAVLASHDDGEVHLTPAGDHGLRRLVSEILVARGHKAGQVLHETERLSSQYLAFDVHSELVGAYLSFDDWVASNRPPRSTNPD